MAMIHGKIRKIGMVTTSSKLDDASYLYLAWSGLKRCRDMLGVKTEIIETGTVEEARESLHYLMVEETDLIWGIGYLMKDPILEYARKYSIYRFATVDAVVEELPPNLTSLEFREQEGAFLAGAAAARASDSGIIGFLGGEDIPLIGKFRAGYQAGAAHVRPGIEVRTAFSNSFMSFKNGMDAARELYEGGCDVVFHAAGSAGKGAIRYAQSTNRKIIGVDTDQSFLAPAQVVTSMVKRIDRSILLTVQALMDRSLTGGTRLEYGLRDDILSLAPLNTDLVPDGTAGEIDSLARDIIAGKIVPPAA